jgi:hypothetical protein
METKEHHQQDSLAWIAEHLRHIEERLSEGVPVKLTWLDSPHICQLLRISKRTLAHYRETGLLPYSRIGGKVYYRLTDIENYLEEHVVTGDGKRDA